MKKVFLLPVFILLAITSLQAQYSTPQNDVWAFGGGAGLNFSTGSPVAISTSINTSEGCADVSDASGNLLFYSDGVDIYNRTGAIMTSGSSIVPFNTSSTTQGCLIVPVIGTTTQYYVFSLQEYSGGTDWCHLDYCIVDMTLSGGLGAVITSTLATPVDSLLAEKLIAVPGNSCNIWLMVHRKDSTKFLAYDITAAGISSTPVESTVGTFTGTDCYTIGVMKVTPDRSKIVSQVYSVGSAQGTELFDFDPNTGIVSNCRVLNTSDDGYGADFSPNSRYLYCEAWGGSLVQYDASLSTAAAIISSATTIIASGTYSDIKLAPDSKMYLRGTAGATYMDCISSPNSAGTSCSLVTSAVTLAGSSSCYDGLPNLYWTSGVGGDTVTKTYDTTLCLLAGASIVRTADTTGTAYIWSDGTTTQSDNISTYGTFWVKVNNGCQVNMDTFKIHALPSDTTFKRADTSVCSSIGTLTITAPAGYANYIWNTTVTTNSIAVTTSGTNIVYCGNGCSVLTDSINVTFDPYLLTTAVADTPYCFPGQFDLIAPSGYANYTWQNGTTSNKLLVDSGGVYYVDGASYCADFVDTFHVIPTTFSINLGPDTTVCSNYVINVPATGANITYKWQDGSTGSSYSADHSGYYYVQVTRGGCVASDTVDVNFTFFAENIPDTVVCKGATFSYDVNCNVPEGGSVMWNDGVTTPYRSFRDSGTWYVYISKGQCEILDTVRVISQYCDCWCDVPSGFTPNGDGLNDVFRPTMQPGCTVSGFQLVVFNRWGQEVYSTDRLGQGWDGTFKGVPADANTYMYAIQYFSGVNYIPVSKTGTVTLIR